MRILDDLLSTLDFDTEVRDIRQGVFHTGVLTRNCGLAATLPRDGLRQEVPMVRKPCSLLGISSLELARMAYSERIFEAAIGMAAINSLIEIDLNSCIELNAAELILKKGTDKNVSIVGHFPFTPKVRKHARNLWVIEKNPKEDDFNESEADRFIPQSDVVAITGTSLTNHTIGHLLSLCKASAYVVMLGDTTPLSPVLFDYGIDALSGVKVVQPEVALRCISQGANFRQIKGIKKIIMTR